MTFMFKILHWGHWLILFQAQPHFLPPNHFFLTPSLVHHTFPEAVFPLDHIKVAIYNHPISHFVFMSLVFSDLGELNPTLYMPEAESKSLFKMKIAMKYSVGHDCLIVNLFRFFIKEVNTFFSIFYTLLYCHICLV